jgi:glucose-1-phosphate thymidylyltransferase
MKACILAGGKGMRLFPLTRTLNKHAVPLGSSPMLWYPLWSLKQASFDEVLIITDRKDAGDIVGICGSGHELGMDITYRFQDRAGGVAEAVGLAKAYTKDEPFICLLGDNVFSYDLKQFVKNYDGGCDIASIFVDDPLRYALLEYTAEGEVTAIHEKPKQAISNLALTGIAIFDNQCFDFIDSLVPSARNELEYTDILNMYIKKRYLYNRVLPAGSWVDAGTFSGLDRAQELIARENILPFPQIKRDNL